MEVVWNIGACNVREVSERLDRKLAYTTVMTTLDRLYKKGFLDREMTDRAFLYSDKALTRRVEPATGRRDDGRVPCGPGGVASPAACRAWSMP